MSAAGQVADNDLATGKIVDTISHSPYWKDSAIFVVEDDSQAGSDHVDSHRAPVQIISPWAQHGIVDSHYYSQIMMIRTIVQILGIHPMNQLDSAASPMAGAFTSTPDHTPFTAVPNRTSLTLGLTTLPPCGADVPAAQSPDAAPAETVATVPTSMQTVAAQWTQWQSQQHLTGPNAVPDYANNEQMNRFAWYETHNWTTPYPGDSKILTPDQVPGAYFGSTESDWSDLTALPGHWPASPASQGPTASSGCSYVAVRLARQRPTRFDAWLDSGLTPVPFRRGGVRGGASAVVTQTVRQPVRVARVVMASVVESGAWPPDGKDCFACPPRLSARGRFGAV